MSLFSVVPLLSCFLSKLASPSAWVRGYSCCVSKIDYVPICANPTSHNNDLFHVTVSDPWMESFRFGQSIRALLSDLWTIEDEEITLACADGYLWRLEVFLRELLAMESLGALERHCSSGSSVLRCISEGHRRMLAVVDDLQCRFDPSDEHSERTPVIPSLSGGVGRPQFDIPQSQLEFLLQVGFSVPRISCLLGVSVSTVRRRMTLYGLSVQSLYTPLNNEQLDAIVSELQGQFPTAGNRQMCGLLRARGIRIQFHRIREAQRRVDPEGSFMRRLHSLYRRRYSVAGPQHLWHMMETIS